MGRPCRVGIDVRIFPLGPFGMGCQVAVHDSRFFEGFSFLVFFSGGLYADFAREFSFFCVGRCSFSHCSHVG